MKKFLVLLSILISSTCLAAFQPFDQETFDSLTYVGKYGGTIWYVNQTSGSDSNSGLLPDQSFATIGKAITEASAGDRILIHQGNYTEAGLDVNKAGLELVFKTGSQLTPATGTALTISAHYCWVGCDNGALKVNVPAGETGVLITGNFAYLAEIRASCGSSGDIGFDIQGDGADLRRCRCSDPLTAAFKIQGDKVKLDECCTGGTPVDTSYGFWMTSSCDKTRLKNCGSQGHGSGGYYIDTGCTNGVVESCYSGGGDGRWFDTDNSFVWSNFEYDETIHKEIEVDTAQTINIFKVTGTVKIFDLDGVVTEIIASGGVPTIHLSVYSTNGEIDITDDPGPNIDGDVVGTVYVRNADSTNALSQGNNDNHPFIVENGSYRDPEVAIIVGADDAADTYIRYNSNAACTDGKIMWYCKWVPVSNDGFLEAL